MSSECSVFVAAELTLIHPELERWLGVPLHAQGGGVWHAELALVPVTFVSPHDMEDEDGLKFSDFEGYVSFGRSAAQNDDDLREQLTHVMARILSNYLRRRFNIKTLVVADSQTVIDN